MDDIEQILKDAKFDFKFENPNDLETERLEAMVYGDEDVGYHDLNEIEEILLRRRHDNGFTDAVVRYFFMSAALTCILVTAFFGWKLYKSIKDKEKKKEEKRKLKQKKKK